MNEIKSYLYSKTNLADEVENWEICLWRVKYNEFMGMAQDRRNEQLIGWTKLDVKTELDGYFEMVKLINAGVREEHLVEQQAVVTTFPS